jgi:hypothetical protein
MIETGKLMPGEGEEEDLEDVEDLDGGEDVEIEDEEEVELEELLNELLGEEKEEKKELEEFELPRIGVDDKAYQGFLKDFNIDPKSPKFGDDLKKIFAKFLALSNQNKAGDTVSLGADIARTGKGSTYRADEAKEMEKTINELKNELNEVNLLNAKLLYTNKIFKAKNLTESEKIKVLNTFDKAETVKEVKLVFETLTESFKATAKKAPIKESLGSASRSISSTQTKQPIIEVNDAFARMQKLAGLRK